jgi:hypothetical protein
VGCNYAGPIALGDLIEALETRDPDGFVCYDFGLMRPTGLCSYRGYYDQLALGYGEEVDTDIKVKDLLGILRDAVGNEFYGWKGGTYTMDKYTPVWAANAGECTEIGIVGVQDARWQVYLITGLVDV